MDKTRYLNTYYIYIYKCLLNRHTYIYKTELSAKTEYLRE